MFRITQLMEELRNPTPLGPRRRPKGPVVIWNLIRRCNLLCQHCYTNSADRDFKGELSTEEVNQVMDDLKAFGVPVLILSGGEPLLRPDIFEISRRAVDMGFYVGLSTNGTLITEDNINQIAEIGYNYVGISLDGIGPVHDLFRGKKGAFDEALRGVRLCREKGLKVGLRFTLTEQNKKDLDGLLHLMMIEDVDKFYMSHLNYSGRGRVNREKDAHHQATRDAMDRLFDEAWRSVELGTKKEFVTGNNDADGVYFLHWVNRHFPDKAEHIRQKLIQWGGNSTGIGIANIDNLGNVHPDSFWWDYSLGNLRERKFSDIWRDLSDPLMAGLKGEQKRPLKGRCGECQEFAICNGNARVRAYQTTGDFWAEDPGCYLYDNEIGLGESQMGSSSETIQWPELN
ncbi:MAG: heme d1 biosynthesis radical SAM protein NirJ [Bdellovibrionales bacterium]|nr:heme d1 biosynthesis radical SAM protein NirJ [Bdellovibrionales bacterium]